MNSHSYRVGITYALFCFHSHPISLYLPFFILKFTHSNIFALARFADKTSFEYEYGIRWKRLYEMYKEKKMLLESDLQAEIEQLERRLAIVKHEHETEKLRQGGCWILVASLSQVFYFRSNEDNLLIVPGN